MKLLHKIGRWQHDQHQLLVLIVRVLIGILVLLKGLVFLISADTFWLRYIAFVYMISGISLIMGLFTRLAALLQLPVVMIQVFFPKSNSPGLISTAGLGLSVLLLIALFYFIIKGGGEISMDHYLKINEL